ncbi:MAG: SHOCT domain-containing protein [Phormidesmis sp.]
MSTSITSRLVHNRSVAIALAFTSALPTPLPLTWLHKFYLGQYLWGIVYLVLAPTLLPQVACCLEGIWYLTQSDDSFSVRFPKAGTLLSSENVSGTSLGSPDGLSEAAHITSEVAIALRDLDKLRQDGLITEYEFEQKRRKLLEQIA